MLIVEDMIDTGRTMVKLLNTLKEHGPKTIRVASLFLKRTERSNGYVPDCVFHSAVSVSVPVFVSVFVCWLQATSAPLCNSSFDALSLLHSPTHTHTPSLTHSHSFTHPLITPPLGFAGLVSQTLGLKCRTSSLLVMPWTTMSTSVTSITLLCSTTLQRRSTSSNQAPPAPSILPFPYLHVCVSGCHSMSLFYCSPLPLSATAFPSFPIRPSFIDDLSKAPSFSGQRSETTNRQTNRQKRGSVQHVFGVGIAKSTSLCYAKLTLRQRVSALLTFCISISLSKTSNLAGNHG